ncbi:hypothetical protein [Solirubrobacter soli]|uniref:hypothetical protein n=1 Tax=Solirubrobacter soli TaxID=363832 RepID=UPI00040BC0C2|nr:hypothetical protein [Solirubrobacter soli]
MTRRIALITTLLVLALPAAAGAQGGAFGSLPPGDPVETPTPAVQTTTADDGSTGRNVLFIVGGVLIIGFAVMGWFILRDARGAVGEPELAGPRLRDAGPHKHKMQAKAKARKKTHAQKAARKAHRKR